MPCHALPCPALLMPLCMLTGWLAGWHRPSHRVCVCVCVCTISVHVYICICICISMFNVYFLLHIPSSRGGDGEQYVQSLLFARYPVSRICYAVLYRADTLSVVCLPCDMTDVTLALCRLSLTMPDMHVYPYPNCMHPTYIPSHADGPFPGQRGRQVCGAAVQVGLA
jgi:hypothetical protein